MGISLSGASQRGIQTGRDRQDLKGSQESLALLVLWGPEERKESEESQAKLDPPDTKKLEHCSSLFKLRIALNN